MQMMTRLLGVFVFASTLAGLSTLAKAHLLSVDMDEVHGRVLEVNEHSILFQVHCDGEVRRVTWNIGVSIDFTSGCRGDLPCNKCGMASCWDYTRDKPAADARVSYLVSFTNGDTAEGKAIKFHGDRIQILDYWTGQWREGHAPNLKLISFDEHCSEHFN